MFKLFAWHGMAQRSVGGGGGYFSLPNRCRVRENVSDTKTHSFNPLMNSSSMWMNELLGLILG